MRCDELVAFVPLSPNPPTRAVTRATIHSHRVPHSLQGGYLWAWKNPNPNPKQDSRSARRRKKVEIEHEARADAPRNIEQAREREREREARIQSLRASDSRFSLPSSERRGTRVDLRAKVERETGPVLKLTLSGCRVIAEFDHVRHAVEANKADSWELAVPMAGYHIARACDTNVGRTRGLQQYVRVHGQ